MAIVNSSGASTNIRFGDLSEMTGRTITAPRQKLPSFLKQSYRALAKQTPKSKHELNKWKVKYLVIKGGAKTTWKWILSINHLEAYRVQEMRGACGVKGGNFSLLSEESGGFYQFPNSKASRPFFLCAPQIALLRRVRWQDADLTVR